MVELDHVFCRIEDPDDAVRRLAAGGWTLDDGQVHKGQGTRNRRLRFADQFLELLWVIDAAEASANPLRLNERTSPFGIGFRGELEDRDGFWLYDALGIRIWVREDDTGDRPLVFVLEGPRLWRSDAPTALRGVRLRGPAAPALPPFDGPPVAFEPGPHRLEVVVGRDLEVSERLALRA